MPKTIRKLGGETPLESLNMSPFQSNRQKQPQIYRLQRNTPILKKQNQMNVRIIKMQIIIILIAIIIYAAIFGIKYLIINSAQAHEQVKNCVEGAKTFNGWNFQINCTKCARDYHLNYKNNSCDAEPHSVHS